MEFCPKCKSPMHPAERVKRYDWRHSPIWDILKCRKCGFEKEIEAIIVSKIERDRTLTDVSIIEYEKKSTKKLNRKCITCQDKLAVENNGGQCEDCNPIAGHGGYSTLG